MEYTDRLEMSFFVFFRNANIKTQNWKEAQCLKLFDHTFCHLSVLEL